MKLLYLPNFKEAKFLGDIDESATGIAKFNNTVVGRYFRLNVSPKFNPII